MIKSRIKSMQVISRIESSLLNKGYMKNNKKITGDGNVLKVKNVIKAEHSLKHGLGYSMQMT